MTILAMNYWSRVSVRVRRVILFLDRFSDCYDVTVASFSLDAPVNASLIPMQRGQYLSTNC